MFFEHVGRILFDDFQISFPNSEILFDFNEGSSGVFKDHLML